MGIVHKIKSIDFLRRLMTQDFENMGTNKYYVDKPESSIGRYSKNILPTGTIEEAGWSPSRMANFYEELSVVTGANPHSMTIVKDSKVISQLSIAPYDVSLRHETHSECKTIVGLAIGIAIDEGLLSLNTTIGDVFPERFSILRSRRMKDITVSQLLRMTTGASFREADVISNADWVTTFLDSGVNFSPGTNFQYNSMNTYMLCAMICRLTSGSLVDYLMPRLFEPLHIHDVLWEKCPMGIEKGGWGCYLTTEEFARMGTLILNKGVFSIDGKNTRVVSEEWIKEMLTPTPFSTYRPDEQYGCQIWLREEGFMFNGMFGQYLLAYPKTNTIIGLNSGGNTTFSLQAVTELIDTYFGTTGLISQATDESDEDGNNNLDEILLRLSGQSVPRQEEKKSLKERVMGWFRPEPIEFDPNNAYIKQISNKNFNIKLPSAGFSPIILQAMHNSWESGPSELSFETIDNTLYLCLIEDNNVKVNVPIGLDDYQETIWFLKDNAFMVRTKGCFGTNEDGFLVLTVRFHFIETSSVRCVKFFFEDSTLRIKMSEMPSISKLMGGYMSGSSLPNSIFGNEQSQEMMLNMLMNLISEPEIEGNLIVKDKSDK